jgi:hypothetical protein
MMNDLKGAVRVDVGRDFCGLQLLQQYITISERNQAICHGRQCSFLPVVQGEQGSSSGTTTKCLKSVPKVYSKLICEI